MNVYVCMHVRKYIYMSMYVGLFYYFKITCKCTGYVYNNNNINTYYTLVWMVDGVHKRCPMNSKCFDFKYMMHVCMYVCLYIYRQDDIIRFAGQEFDQAIILQASSIGDVFDPILEMVR